MRRAEPLIGADTPELVVARFQFGLAMVGLHGGVEGAERLRLLDAALATLERHPPSVVLVYALCMRGYVAGICGELTLARRTLDRVHALMQLPPLAPLRGIPLYIEGMVRRFEGRPHDALAAYTEALPYVRRHGDGRTLFYLQNNMAAVHHEMGHLDEAVDQYRRAIATLEASPRTDAEMMAFVLNWYAHALTAQGALDDALEQVRRSLPYCRRSVGVRHFAGMLGLLAARQGRLREAALLLGCDDAARQRRGEVRTPFDQRTMKAILALVGAEHAPERVAVWRLQGTALEEAEVAALVLQA
jgi:tetratricopeptide (TPR) repeat protein